MRRLEGALALVLGSLALAVLGLGALLVGLLVDGGPGAERLVQVGVSARGGMLAAVLVLGGCALGVAGLLGACGLWLFGGRA